MHCNQKISIFVIIQCGICLIFTLPQMIFAQQSDSESEPETIQVPEQVIEEGRFSFGIKGGVNANRFDNIQGDFLIIFDDDDDGQFNQAILSPSEGYSSGFNGGFFFRFQMTEVVGLQLEALYNQQGGVRKKLGLLGIKQARVTMHNAEVPLLLDFRLFHRDGISGRLVTGGAASYNLFSSQDYTNLIYDPQLEVLTLTEGSFEIVTSQYRPMQFGAYLGTRFDSAVGSLKLHLDIRYRFGIGRVNELRRISDQFDARADTFSISLGLGL